jgi:hypothetical protein
LYIAGERAAAAADPLCGERQPLTVSLTPAELQLEVAELQLPAVLVGRPWGTTPASDLQTVRLRACMSRDGTAEIVEVAGSFGFAVFDPAQFEIRSTGQGSLQQALAGQVEQFELAILERGVHASGLLLRGQRVRGRPVIALYQVRPLRDGRLELTASHVVYGVLSATDVFARCSVGEQYQEVDFTLGTASFRAAQCVFLGGGETTGYRILRLGVKDSADELPPERRDVWFEWEGEALAERLVYRWNHHNACDSFYLDARELGARYAASTPPMAGCGTVVTHAPLRSFEDGDGQLHFVVDHGQGFGPVQRVADWEYFFRDRD